MMRRSMRFILRSENTWTPMCYGIKQHGCQFSWGIKVETTHVGKKLPKNNNLMQVELGEVVVIQGM
jgi:hypothetical protein